MVTNEDVAIKVERVDSKKQVLKLEVAVLKKLQVFNFFFFFPSFLIFLLCAAVRKRGSFRDLRTARRVQLSGDGAAGRQHQRAAPSPGVGTIFTRHHMLARSADAQVHQSSPRHGILAQRRERGLQKHLFFFFFFIRVFFFFS